MAQALSLINSIISSPDDVEERVKTRKQFIKIKLEKKLEALRYVLFLCLQYAFVILLLNFSVYRTTWESSEAVTIQLNVYAEEKEEDKKQLKIWSVRLALLHLIDSLLRTDE